MKALQVSIYNFILFEYLLLETDKTLALKMVPRDKNLFDKFKIFNNCASNKKYQKLSVDFGAQKHLLVLGAAPKLLNRQRHDAGS